MAIVPTNNGSIDVYSPGPGNLILDLSTTSPREGEVSIGGDNFRFYDASIKCLTTDSYGRF